MLYINSKTYFTASLISIYFTTRNTRNAVIRKSINVEITLPYRIHLYERSSIFLTLSLVRIGLRIIGVIRLSIIHFTSSPTLVATSNQIAIPMILYWERKAINSLNIGRDKKVKSSEEYRGRKDIFNTKTLAICG